MTEAYAADAQYVLPSLEEYEARQTGRAPAKAMLPECNPSNGGALQQQPFDVAQNRMSLGGAAAGFLFWLARRKL